MGTKVEVEEGPWGEVTYRGRVSLNVFLTAHLLTDALSGQNFTATKCLGSVVSALDGDS